jgi:voltage-gated sodium channel
MSVLRNGPRSTEYVSADGFDPRGHYYAAVEMDAGPPQELLDLAATLSEQVNPLEKAPLWVQWIMGSTFQASAAVMIMANVGVIGMETEITDAAEFWQKVQLVFLAFFTIEVTLRIFAEGVLAGVDLDGRCHAFAFFQGPGYLWNVFDFGVVILGCADAVLMSLTSTGKERKFSGLFTLLRCLRLLRIFRMLRVVRTLAPNSYRLLEALMNAVKVLRWILILFIVIIVLSAVITTNMARDYVDNEDVREEVQIYWGAIWKSCYSLFQVVTLDDWATCTRCLTESSTSIYLFFVCFIILTSFTVMSLLTGVISDNVIETAGEEEDESKKKAARDRELFAVALRGLYDKANTRDNFNGVTRSALAYVVSHFSHPALKEKFSGLEMPYKDVERAAALKKYLGSISGDNEAGDAAPTPTASLLSAPGDQQEHPLLRLFDLLDTDRSGDLDWNELRAGLACPVEGEVRSKDMLAFEAECRRFELQLLKSANNVTFQNAEGPKLVQDSIGLAQAITLKFQESAKSVDEIRRTLR